MTIKSSESLIDILRKVRNSLEEEGYQITILKQKNGTNIFYQLEGIKSRDTEDKIMVRIFQKIDGNKTVEIVQKDKNELLKKFDLTQTFSISLSENFSLEKSEEILKKLNKLKDKNLIEFFLKKTKNENCYKITCLNERYQLTINHYFSEKIVFQGANSEFTTNIFNYLFKNDIKIFEIGESYEEKLSVIIGNLEDNAYQRFLNRKAISYEQKAVIESEENIVVVNAVAGSGKTTTLEGVISRWNGKKILYIVYNKKMKEEAEQRFKYYQNVKIVTGHSMAYEKYSLRNTRESFDIFEINKKLKIRFVDAVYLIKVFQKFLIGKNLEHETFIATNEEMLKKIFFETYFSTFIGNVNRRKEYKNNEVKISFNKKYKEIIEFLKEEKLYEQMEKKFIEEKYTLLEKFQKLDDFIMKKEISETHDYYLKKFQIDREKIYKYEIVMLDEAQDSNEVIIDIMEYKFPQARKIIVGDTQQQIYEWRGAKNAMEYFSNIDKAKLYSLSVSYRISQNTANVCMEILAIKNAYLNIIGKNSEQEKISLALIREKIEGKLTILFRKNFNMILRALETSQKVTFLKDINLEKYIDVNHFYCERLDEIKYLHYLKKYKDYNQLIFHIGQGWEENPDIIIGVRLIELLEGEFESKLFDLHNRMISYEEYLKSEDESILLLGTIHGSKGYEFDRLMIDLDSLDFIENIEMMTKEEISQELNLIYVALTRSSKKIHYILEIEFLKNLLHFIFVNNQESNLTNRGVALKKLHQSTIKEIIKEKEIKELVHFTNMKNLKSILDNGICSQEYMNREKILYVQNDFTRYDDEYDYISVSLSFPNYKMLYNKKNESKSSYIILSLTPEILLEKECLFLPTNASHHKFRGKLKEYSSFKHFAELFDNSNLDFPKNYAKDPQAEILIKELIEPKYIKCVYLEKNDFTEKRANYKHKNAEHIDFQLGQEYFEKRKW